MAHFLIFTLILAAHGSEIQVVSNDFSFAMVNHATGLAECWGDVKYGGDCSGVNFAGVRQVKANSRSMAVLTSTGGSCWGYTAYGGDCSTIGLSGMTELHSTDLSYLAFDAVGQRGICWGHSSYGGSCGAIDFSQVTKISSNKYAYVAYSASTHTLQCWGSSSYGGNCEASAFTGSSLSEVTELIASIGAFVAFDRTAGTISCWGSSAYGGDCSSVTLTGITEVHTNGKAFVALNKNSGLGQCWGGQWRQLQWHRLLRRCADLLHSVSFSGLEVWQWTVLGRSHTGRKLQCCELGFSEADLQQRLCLLGLGQQWCGAVLGLGRLWRQLSGRQP
ncbi:Uncharacterized protein SCF082_LOCUS20579 [Durusdinium trenchii]|uniref:Uncharacterized protein n=1 Tax=Durusdinium trenchii TaxID=1381693 RepID=A0ABP0L4B1_9DINO